IVLRSAEILGAKVEPGGAGEIARRARGTPRIVNRLLRRVRDYAQVAGDGIITAAIARDALDKEGVDGRGLDRLDRRFLTAIVEHYGGGPVGIEAVAATINGAAASLTEMVEPYLLKIGFVVRTPTGRRVTREAYLHLERQPPTTQGGQGGLFELRHVGCRPIPRHRRRRHRGGWHRADARGAGAVGRPADRRPLHKPRQLDPVILP